MILSRPNSDWTVGKPIKSKGMQIFNGSLPDAKSFFTIRGLPCQLEFNPADHYIWETSVNIDNPGESMRKIEDSFHLPHCRSH